MITVAVAGTLAAIAVPNMRDFMRNNRLSSSANDMLRSVQVRARRRSSVKRSSLLLLEHPNATNPTCSGGALTGWIVFQDANNNWDRDAGEDILDRQTVPNGVMVTNNNTGKVSYNATGFANSTPGQTPISRVVICDPRQPAVGDNSVARALIIEPTGRARTTKDLAEITNALGVIGGTCHDRAQIQVRSRPALRGFTLVEALVALVVLAVGMLGIASL